jgi:hypothetical protein
MDAITVNEASQGVQRKSAVRLHIMPIVTVVVLLYTLVMTLIWLRDQINISLVTRPYAAAVTSDDSEMSSTILTTLRGWLSSATDSTESMIDSIPVQQARDTLISVVRDFRDLLTIENTAAEPGQPVASLSAAGRGRKFTLRMMRQKIGSRPHNRAGS